MSRSLWSICQMKCASLVKCHKTLCCFCCNRGTQQGNLEMFQYMACGNARMTRYNVISLLKDHPHWLHQRTSPSFVYFLNLWRNSIATIIKKTKTKCIYINGLIPAAWRFTFYPCTPPPKANTFFKKPSSFWCRNLFVVLRGFTCWIVSCQIAIQGTDI